MEYMFSGSHESEAFGLYIKCLLAVLAIFFVISLLFRSPSPMLIGEKNALGQLVLRFGDGREYTMSLSSRVEHDKIAIALMNGRHGIYHLLLIDPARAAKWERITNKYVTEYADDRMGYDNNMFQMYSAQRIIPLGKEVAEALNSWQINRQSPRAVRWYQKLANSHTAAKWYNAKIQGRCITGIIKQPEGSQKAMNPEQLKDCSYFLLEGFSAQPYQ